MDWLEQLTVDGYALLPAVFTAAEMDSACTRCTTALQEPTAAPSLLRHGDGPPHGARNLLLLWPDAVLLARDNALVRAIERVLGPHAGIVRSLYFDKPPGEGWALPWHRDTVIAVARHGPLATLRHPTHKAGVPHVDAPGNVMDKMLTARIHIDDMDDRNGPLRVIPRSHLATAAEPASEQAAVTIHCHAGDVLLMRPLLLHASGHCVQGHRGHRRVLQLEFAPTPELPDGYRFHTYLPLHATPPCQPPSKALQLSQ